MEVFNDARDLANAPSVASAESDAFVTLCAHLNYQQTAANPQIGSQQSIPAEHTAILGALPVRYHCVTSALLGALPNALLNFPSQN